MTENESRTFVGVAGFLLLASLLRYGMEWSAPPPLAPEGPGSLPALIGASEIALDEREERSRPLAPGERIDINSATEAQLNRLPGVGRSIASAIVKDREERGAFAAPDDLQRVSGIGPASVERLRAHLEARGGGHPARSAPGFGPSGLVNVNRASAEELVKLPGIGPALAGRIIERRAIGGGFKTVEDLLDVPGIGRATLEKLRPLVHVGQ